MSAFGSIVSSSVLTAGGGMADPNALRAKVCSRPIYIRDVGRLVSYYSRLRNLGRGQVFFPKMASFDGGPWPVC